MNSYKIRVFKMVIQKKSYKHIRKRTGVYDRDKFFFFQRQILKKEPTTISRNDNK